MCIFLLGNRSIPKYYNLKGNSQMTTIVLTEKKKISQFIDYNDHYNEMLLKNTK